MSFSSPLKFGEAARVQSLAARVALSPEDSAAWRELTALELRRQQPRDAMAHGRLWLEYLRATGAQWQAISEPAGVVIAALGEFNAPCGIVRFCDELVETFGDPEAHAYARHHLSTARQSVAWQKVSTSFREGVQLAPEALLVVWSFLGLVDLARVCATCSRFRALARSNDLWRPHCLRALIGASEIAEWRHGVPESGTWEPFALSLQNILEQAHQKGKDRVQYTDGGVPFVADLRFMVVYPSSAAPTYEELATRGARTVGTAWVSVVRTERCLWQREDEEGNWVLFPAPVSLLIEDSYVAGAAACALVGGLIRYKGMELVTDSEEVFGIQRIPVEELTEEWANYLLSHLAELWVGEYTLGTNAHLSVRPGKTFTLRDASGQIITSPNSPLQCQPRIERGIVERHGELLRFQPLTVLPLGDPTVVDENDSQLVSDGVVYATYTGRLVHPQRPPFFSLQSRRPPPSIHVGPSALQRVHGPLL
eukprot:TRINITY_DN16049_c0_g1_i1.p1 TRINITY_DN16049_c0_g1~~TRINITY_DN16049_c0_g1_i1.p1  ORF type:complete len:488 (+),score=54.48 TRINITY_DN16049_c0_g1_i1:22-1464(+)